MRKALGWSEVQNIATRTYGCGEPTRGHARESLELANKVRLIKIVMRVRDIRFRPVFGMDQALYALVNSEDLTKEFGRNPDLVPESLLKPPFAQPALRPHFIMVQEIANVICGFRRFTVMNQTHEKNR